MKKLFAVGTTALMALGIALAMPLSASANEEVCTPKDAYTETVIVTDAHWQRYSYKGAWPSNEEAPPFPSDSWQANTASDPHGIGVAGAYFQSKGNSGHGDWFYLEWVEAVTKDVHHDAVVCPPPVEVPEEPTTYLPSCTTVLGYGVIEGDGVMAVAGDWATTTIGVPFSGTLADIGTALDIQADPLPFVGLHIVTDHGKVSFEEEPSYAGKLWSNTAWEGVSAGMGYTAFGTIEEFIHLNGDAVVTDAYLLYTHPEASTTTVESFTIGCTSYTFEPKKSEPVPPVDSEKPAADKPKELAMTGPGSALLIGALGTALLGGGTLLARRFG